MNCECKDAIKIAPLLSAIKIPSSTLHLSAIKMHHLDVMDLFWHIIFWRKLLILLLTSVGTHKKLMAQPQGCGVLSIHTYYSIGSHMSTNGSQELWQQCEQK